MMVFDRFNIRVVAAAAGLCGVAVALSADVAAAPLITGGSACVQTTAGEAGGASPVAAMCSSASAPLSDMAGIPMALPGPVPVVAPAPLGAPAPVGAPLGAPAPVGAPLGAPVPVGAPLGAPVPVGAPLIDNSGVYGGKGQPTGPPPDGAPVSGQPILPGPAADGAR
jgi:hypothetical protein